ncbi:MAG: hypothetical protein Kilf2KO_38380 [Rhodospirillales bacterium]
MKEPEFHEHVRTYRGFLRASLWTVIIVAIVLALMGAFLT